MASIQVVNSLGQRQGLNLARRLADHFDVSAVFWWADEDQAEPRLFVGFDYLREVGPLECIRRVSNTIAALGPGEAPSFLQTTCIATDDPRIELLHTQPWHMAKLNSSDLTYRLLNVYSPASGYAQALVYHLRSGGAIEVGLPPSV